MAEETKTTAAPDTPPPAAGEVPVSTVPAPEKTEAAPVPESAEPTPAAEEKVEESDAAAAEIAKEEKITESASFKEESNVVAELPDPEKKAINELKELVKQALIKHEFTSPPPPIAKEEEKKPEIESKPEEEKKESEAESKPEEKIEEKEAVGEETKPEEEKKEAETTAVVETPPPPPAAPAVETPETTMAVVVEETVEKKEETKTVEEVKETIVEDSLPPPAAEEAVPVAAEEPAPVSPEEVSIWGIPLLADERSDTIFLKFLRARDFKVKEAFLMLKNVVAWRKEFGIETLLEEEEEIVVGWDKIVFMDGIDKEGHPVCYNSYGEFQDKELYQSAFGDAEKQSKFLKWRILFLEKSIRKLDFSPDGISTIVQVNDLKNSPGLYLFKKELRQATNQALQLLQDNYPEFVAKQVFINVPWWYVTYNRMISPFLTARTKSKFVFAGPSRTAEVLFKYITPEHVPIQYGGLCKEGEQEFSSADSATEDTIKPASKHTIEFSATEPSTLVWEARVLGWEAAYSAEFVPTAEGSYTVIVQKARKIGAGDEPVVGGSYKVIEAGKVVLTFDNQTSKKKKLLYRFKTKASE